MKKTVAFSARTLVASACLLGAQSALASFTLDLVDDIEVAGDPEEIHEIVSVEGFTGNLFATFDTGVRSYNFDGSTISSTGLIDLSDAFVFANITDTVGSVSSVAVDPLGRGFGAAAVIPNQSHLNLGSVVIFDTATNEILRTLDAGWHPDMVTFSADGSSLLVANEGEPVIIDTNTGLRAEESQALSSGELGLADKRGSLTYIDVSGVTSGNKGFTPLASETYDFTAPNLGAGVTPLLDALRVNAANEGGNEFIDVEPEYITVEGSHAFVSMQENNAVAVFDLATKTWTDIQDLGTIEQDKVDVSDDDGAVVLDDFIKGLPMPDAIASYSVGGNTYYITANEGDGREYLYGEDESFEHLLYSDEERMEDETDPAAAFGFTSPGFVEPTFAQRNDDAEYGRLKVINDQFTDIDDDGDIDVLQAFGTRSFTIWDDDGNIVFDSGSLDSTDLSQITVAASTYPDGRSDDKGPEPESVEVGVIDGTVLAFVSLERSGGIAMYDVTDPTNTVFLDYVIETGESPEGLDFFEYEGNYYLAVAYEGSEDPGLADIEIFQVVPEPSSLALLGLGGLLIARRRRG